jgi:hypothetical protein
MCSEGLPFGLSALDPFYQWCTSRVGIQGLHKYLTYRKWLQKELVTFVEDRLAEACKAGLPFLNTETARRLAREHAAGRKNYTREINAVLTLEAIQRLLVRGGAKLVNSRDRFSIAAGSYSNRHEQPDGQTQRDG